ncbi:hypothetical protein GCM10011571_04460 [Marinithermofilum abyssi]|uniref:Uncharacterized protein n=2 Tax=Marinithermofilum abyssi TaxID=1571185 RepID=A0A8J2VBJ7_9BACL|nr:hypothetical protein GCM10011571_04460 [Marinithermofilum abyssi]
MRTPYVYNGPFYALENVEVICPWCIKNGAAAKKFDGSFQDAGSCEVVADKSFLES